MAEPQVLDFSPPFLIGKKDKIVIYDSRTFEELGTINLKVDIQSFVQPLTNELILVNDKVINIDAEEIITLSSESRANLLPVQKTKSIFDIVSTSNKAFVIKIKDKLLIYEIKDNELNKLDQIQLNTSDYIWIFTTDSKIIYSNGSVGVYGKKGHKVHKYIVYDIKETRETVKDLVLPIETKDIKLDSRYSKSESLGSITISTSDIFPDGKFYTTIFKDKDRIIGKWDLDTGKFYPLYTFKELDVFEATITPIMHPKYTEDQRQFFFLIWRENYGVRIRDTYRNQEYMLTESNKRLKAVFLEFENKFTNIYYIGNYRVCVSSDDNMNRLLIWNMLEKEFEGEWNLQLSFITNEHSQIGVDSIYDNVIFQYIDDNENIFYYIFGKNGKLLTRFSNISEGLEASDYYHLTFLPDISKSDREYVKRLLEVQLKGRLALPLIRIVGKFVA